MLLQIFLCDSSKDSTHITLRFSIFLHAFFEKSLHTRASGGPFGGLCKKSHSGGKVDLARHAPTSVHNMLRLNQELGVEACDSSSKAVDESFEFSVRDSAVDPPVQLGSGGIIVVRAEEDLQGSCAADHSRKPLEGSPTGDDADSDLGLAEDGPLTARKAHVAVGGEVGAEAPCAAPNGGDGDGGETGDADGEAGPGGGEAGSGALRLFANAEDVGVGDEVVGAGGVEDDDADGFVGFKLDDKVVEGNVGFGGQEVEGAVVEGGAPVGGSDLVDDDVFGGRHGL